MQKSVIFSEENLKINMWRIKRNCKVRNHCHYTGEYRGVVHNICNLKQSVPKKIHMAFYNESNYDYHFIIKDLPEEFKKQFTCLRKGTEKQNDNARFMASPLSNLVNNLSEGTHRIKCKHKNNDKKC